MKYLAAPGIIGRTFQNVFIAFLSDILAKFAFGKINIKVIKQTKRYTYFFLSCLKNILINLNRKNQLYD